MTDEPSAEQLVIEESLVAYLLGVGPVRALIGERIYKGVADSKATFPYLVYTVVSDVDELTLTAAMGSPVATIQLDCWGKGGIAKPQAARLYRALRDALHGFGPGQMGSHWVDFAQLTDRSDQGEDPQGGGTQGDHRIMTELTIAYSDTVPSFGT